VSVQVLQGDCRDQLATLPAGSVQTCVTSPPYLTGGRVGSGAVVQRRPVHPYFVEFAHLLVQAVAPGDKFGRLVSGAAIAPEARPYLCEQQMRDARLVPPAVVTWCDVCAPFAGAAFERALSWAASHGMTAVDMLEQYRAQCR